MFYVWSCFYCLYSKTKQTLILGTDEFLTAISEKPLYLNASDNSQHSFYFYIQMRIITLNIAGYEKCPITNNTAS